MTEHERQIFSERHREGEEHHVKMKMCYKRTAREQRGTGGMRIITVELQKPWNEMTRRGKETTTVIQCRNITIILRSVAPSNAAVLPLKTVVMLLLEMLFSKLGLRACHDWSR